MSDSEDDKPLTQVKTEVCIDGESQRKGEERRGGEANAQLLRADH
jgi:hypothetical protein